MMNKITVIGSGAMATATALTLRKAGNKDITIYGIDEKELNELSKGTNSKYFPQTFDPFKTTLDISEALEGTKFIVMAVPSQFMNKVFEQVLNTIKTEVIIINVAKGFYPGTKDSLHEGMSNAAKNTELCKGVVSIIGPAHAEEIVKYSPTMVSSVSSDIELAKTVATLFSSDFFRVYIQTDVIGAEVGAAYKNVLAIASGIIEGKGYGINSIAALLTRGLTEMVRFSLALGGKTETIYGLTGIGDLIVTATSNLSRNFTFGKIFANDRTIINTNKTTVEGLTALKHINEIAKEKKLDLPILYALYMIIYEGADFNQVFKELWNRDIKVE